MNVQFQIYGNDFDKAGDYLRSFFDGVEASPFWLKNNFQKKGEESYRGDSPVWHPEVGLVQISLKSEFTRIHVPGLDGAGG